MCYINILFIYLYWHLTACEKLYINMYTHSVGLLKAEYFKSLGLESSRS